MKLAVAIIPTNQDTVPVVGNGNEMQQVAPFCDALLEAFQLYPGITAKVFTAEPESQDTYEYEALYAIQKEAANWLKSFDVKEYKRLATNWHTDSEKYSHTGGYYETYTIESKQLVDLLVPALNRWINGTMPIANYSGYIFAKSLKGVAPAILMEIGSHEMIADVQVLASYKSTIASAAASIIATYYGQVPTGILEHLDMLWGYSNELTKSSDALTLSAQGVLAQATAVRRAADIVKERVVAIKQELGL